MEESFEDAVEHFAIAGRNDGGSRRFAAEVGEDLIGDVLVALGAP